jgi:hypothetical protein
MIKMFCLAAATVCMTLGLTGCGAGETSSKAVVAPGSDQQAVETISDPRVEPKAEDVEQKEEDIPDGKRVIDLIQQASTFYGIFDMETLLVDNNCLEGEEYQYYCEVNDSNIHSYEDLQNQLEAFYSPETAAAVLSAQVGEYPDHSKSYLRYEHRLYAISGGRGASLGYDNLWDQASANLVRHEDDHHLVYRFVLPNRQENEIEESFDYGRMEMDVELVKEADEWKLNTVIDTLGM